MEQPWEAFLQGLLQDLWTGQRALDPAGPAILPHHPWLQPTPTQPEGAIWDMANVLPLARPAPQLQEGTPLQVILTIRVKAQALRQPPPPPGGMGYHRTKLEVRMGTAFRYHVEVDDVEHPWVPAIKLCDVVLPYEVPSSQDAYLMALLRALTDLPHFARVCVLVPKGEKAVSELMASLTAEPARVPSPRLVYKGSRRLLSLQLTVHDFLRAKAISLCWLQDIQAETREVFLLEEQWVRPIPRGPADGVCLRALPRGPTLLLCHDGGGSDPARHQTDYAAKISVGNSAAVAPA